jgi:uncharacterized protein YndB with AHSA1/START domain
VSEPTPAGAITITGDRATLTYERRLPYAIDAVWSALTDPAQRALWLGATTIEGRKGGMIETVTDGPPAPPERRHMSGRILTWDPPRVLEHEWLQQGVRASVVRYELTADGDATLLHFTHAGLQIPEARGYGPGHHAYLDRLRAALDGCDVPDWGQRYATAQPAYA